MTNSPESDSIAEKPEVVKTEAKSNRWNWKTVIAATLTAAVNTISLASALIQPVRQRLNQWNWRKKTALVTALAITAGGVFYQQRAHAAVFSWPAVITSAGTKEFLVKLFVSISVSRAVNSALDKKIKKTAYAQTDGWLYRNREYYRQDYSYSGSTTTKGLHIDAEAMADEDKTHDTEGTRNGTTLDKDEVLDYVSHNTHLRRGITEEYQILNRGEPLYQWDIRFGNTESRRTLQTFVVHYGGYVQKLTAEEIQEELDDMRDDWNRYIPGRNSGRRFRRPVTVGKLTLGPKVSRTVKSFTLDKEVKLWSDFDFNRVPGDTTAGPKELQEPGNRSTYVTSFKYTVREAGYGPLYGLISTRNKEEITQYPEPRSYEGHDFMRFRLTEIPWSRFKITVRPVWTGDATRHFKHRKSRACQHTVCYAGIGRITSPPGLSLCRTTTKREFPVYQNESVVKP